MTPREKLGLDLANAIVTFIDSVPDRPDQRERLARVLAGELDDETMESLRGSFAARNARASSKSGRVRR